MGSPETVYACNLGNLETFTRNFLYTRQGSSGLLF